MKQQQDVTDKNMNASSIYTRKQILDLCYEELCEPLRQPAFFTGEDHLQHVTMELLHHHKHFLWGLKHTLQVHNSKVT